MVPEDPAIHPAPSGATLIAKQESELVAGAGL
jgi:hypothetical protein